MIREMSDCVCGAYIQAPKFAERTKIQTITFDVVIQVDDFLPFSAFEYFPRFLVVDLELELSASLYQNMVFCPVPPMAAIDLGLYNCSVPDYFATFKGCDGRMDYKFHACGDYASAYLPYVSNSSEETGQELQILDFTLSS